MSLSEIFVKGVGVVLGGLGLLVILVALGLPFLPITVVFLSVGFFVALVVGALLIAGGVVIVRGGNITA